MKIRQDFVSNSSSTSFVLYGVSLDSAEVEKHIKKPDESWPAEDVFSQAGVECYVSDGMQRAYAGMSPVMMADNETLKQFKDRVMKKICDVYPEAANEKVKYIQGISYDDGVSVDTEE